MNAALKWGREKSWAGIMPRQRENAQQHNRREGKYIKTLIPKASARRAIFKKVHLGSRTIWDVRSCADDMKRDVKGLRADQLGKSGGSLKGGKAVISCQIKRRRRDSYLPLEGARGEDNYADHCLKTSP